MKIVALITASVGALFMGCGDSLEVRTFTLERLDAEEAYGLVGPRPVVKAEGHRSVAVLPTENPNITVIWFME